MLPVHVALPALEEQGGAAHRRRHDAVPGKKQQGQPATGSCRAEDPAAWLTVCLFACSAAAVSGLSPVPELGIAASPDDIPVPGPISDDQFADWLSAATRIP